MNNMTTVRTIHHAAHFGYAMKGANDLIQVDHVAEVAFPVPAAAREVGAEFHHGYRVGDVQHWVYIKAVRAPDGSTCERCKDVV